MKKSFIYMLCAALVVSVFFSCSKKKSDDENDKTVTLEMYYYKSENQGGLKEIVKRFEDENPDILINMLIIPNNSDKAMLSRAKQGDLPDLLQMQSYSRLQEYAANGWIINLSEEKIMQKLMPYSLESVTYNGKQYGFPVEYSGIGIFYNQAILDKFGLKVPETFSELEKLCSVLKSKNITPFCGALKENWPSGHFLSMVHSELIPFDRDYNAYFSQIQKGNASYGDVSREKLFKIMDFYRDNMNENAAVMNCKSQYKSFAAGEACMMVQILSACSELQQINPDLKLTFAPFPVNDEKSDFKFYADVDSVFCISSQSSERKQEACRKFLEWLTTVNGRSLWVSEYNLIPPFIDFEGSEPGTVYSGFDKSVKNNGSCPWLFTRYPSKVFENSIKNCAQQYFLGKITGEELISKIDEDWKNSGK